MEEYHRLEATVLGVLSGRGKMRVEDIAQSASVPVQSAYYGASLLAERGLVKIRELERKRHVLTPRGEEALEKGLPEELLMEAVCESGRMEIRRALKILDGELASVALGQAKAQGLVSIEEGIIMPTPKGEAAARDRPLREDLRRVHKEGRAEHAEELIRRGLIESSSVTERYAELTPRGIGIAGQAKADDRIVDLVPDIIKDGSWRERGFRPFDVSAPAPPFHGARKQPYRRFLDGIRSRLVSLGFVEMTGPLVELAFWNFDALFQAQNHPAREVHDTFLIKEPSHGRLPDRQIVERVKLTHENGWETGSRGWGYIWSEEEASRLVARSQGTALSARTLAAGIDPPAKHFSIARVFRPDVLDRTHLIEFNQCEGIIADNGLTFRHLLGILRMFALEIANESKFAFVPSYYPFTEPSVDLVAYSEAQEGWVELGGAGIFRQEVTQPLGVGIPVIAWGMGIDRLAMFSLGLDDIRELFSQNLDWLRSSRVVT